MTWHLRIDPELCIASGACAGTAPDLFVLDDVHARPVRERIPEGDERALDAADVCPAMAISVHDADGKEIGPRD
ncbi:ferredoxin [Streptomyces tsukubensis]|uniref:Ferredoxin n=1 Tax=Streptomyces tsukubensis TaxID=83656 RepID=A0A1V4ADE9_9ACTN|nr:ferredoxin [Streptomyces tsukubensis]OON81585.1 cytochrome [Streptomyces tsukubensis]QFR96356.1 ferredoxin [Streptomyces tsukubensis]